MTMTVQDYTYVTDLVRRRSSITLDATKQFLVEARLVPLAREMGVGTVGDLVAELRRTPDAHPLRGRVVEAMTTNETWWFRDNRPFEALKNVIVPELKQKRAHVRRLAIWSAACSTGQEPYSIAMVMQQVLAHEPQWSFSVLASDLSQEVLDRARAGVYDDGEVKRNLPPEARMRYFTATPAGLRVTDAVKANVSFRQLNLADPPALPGFDVVFLRNVLIYFDIETKRKVLATVRRVLRPDGYLFLGAAETTVNVDENFERVFVSGTPCYRIRPTA